MKGRDVICRTEGMKCEQQKLKSTATRFKSMAQEINGWHAAGITKNRLWGVGVAEASWKKRKGVGSEIVGYVGGAEGAGRQKDQARRLTKQPPL